MPFIEKNFVDYFENNLPSNCKVEKNKFKIENRNKDVCFKQTLESIFKIKLDCALYESVASGQGNEKEKMTTIYSSSLQSFLIFSQVSENNPIKIGEHSYTEVHFEYKNKAFNYPSCIDVVLLDHENKHILFIESKLGEIVRDSNTTGAYVVGPSYFSSNGYPLIIKNKADLENIGIDVPSEYGNSNASLIKKSILKVRTSPADGSTMINKLKDSTYVYSYGIKQILSHILGIYNFKKLKDNEIPENCDTYLSRYSDYDVEFMEIFNALPNIDDEGKTNNDSNKKIEDFAKHVDETFKITKNVCSLSKMKYQELYEENIDNYFSESKNMSLVVEFYHLKNFTKNKSISMFNKRIRRSEENNGLGKEN